MKLDLTKPYGTVHGSLDDRRYEQGGRFFDYRYEEVAAGAETTQPLDDNVIRKRTRAEQEAYDRDVAEAAKVFAARMSAEKK